MTLPVLRAGDRVAVVAPAGPVDGERLRRGCARLQGWGLEPRPGPAVQAVDGFLAGSDVARATDLEEAFLKADVRGVFYARGGYGTTRLLERLDRQRMAASGRLLVGFSDATALGLALSAEAPFPYLYAPSVSDLGSPDCDADLESLRRGLFGEHPGGLQRLTGLMSLRDGRARGVVLGGCLSLVTALIGTPSEARLEGRILMLEDVKEEPYRLDRMLTQLRAAGRLDSVAGVLLGQFTGCVPRDPRRPSWSADEVLARFAAGLQVPVLAGLPVGHGAGRVSVPLGVEVEMDAAAGTVAFHHR